jgi:hypothetical protein
MLTDAGQQTLTDINQLMLNDTGQQMLNDTDQLNLPDGLTSQLNLPDGWTSPHLERLLFNYAQQSHRILEIGSFVGRSTCVICYAIKQSGNQIHFDTCDIHFRTEEEFQSFYKKICQSLIEIPSLQKHYINHGGTMHHLKKNLIDRELDHLVNCHKGCFKRLDERKVILGNYDLIYCDVSHDRNEINANLPHIKKLLDQTQSTLICNHIINDELKDLILNYIDFDEYELNDHIFVGKIKLN